MENYGLVSIITPSYNSANYIKDTIESVLSQTYPYWELLITDDCSTDNSVEIIIGYAAKDSRIKLLKIEKNSGAGICRNKSIENARGRFIAFCDSDDWWFPQKLEKQLEFMRLKDCALSYSSYMVMDESKTIMGVSVCMSVIDYRSMKREDGIGCLTAIYDVEKVGKMYFPSVRKRQDWGLWLEILSQCKVSYGIKEPLAYYRVRKNSISRNKWALIKYNISIYRTVLGYSYLKAIFIFLVIYLPHNFFKKIRTKLNSL
ncbi:glycosyltransferase family 2 protein [Bacteroides sp.]|uniref:glycosyltransferase family 2 protein n=1 Tax=Bacteroides sp. TaxID=29523 RepID=UPI0026146BB5|nr:glycosyltransferase family 2 protein [Bacteroides sp.]